MAYSRNEIEALRSRLANCGDARLTPLAECSASQLAILVNAYDNSTLDWETYQTVKSSGKGV